MRRRVQAPRFRHQPGRTFGKVPIHAETWRRLSLWADGGCRDEGLTTHIFIAVTLFFGTLLCFGLRATLASCRAWLHLRSSSVGASPEYA